MNQPKPIISIRNGKKTFGDAGVTAFEVPFPNPRDITKMFEDPRLPELCNSVWRQLRDDATAELSHTVDKG